MRELLRGLAEVLYCPVAIADALEETLLAVLVLIPTMELGSLGL